MPCFDDRDHIREVYRDGHDPKFKRMYELTQKKLDNITDLLCKAGRARANRTNIPKEVLDWWDDHCEKDRARGEPW